MHGPSFEEIWIPITKGCFVPSLVEICPVVPEKILKFRQYMFVIALLPPLEKAIALYLKKNCIPLYQDALCQVKLKLAHLFYRRCIFAILLLSRFGLRHDINWTPFTQWCIVPNLVEIGLLVLEKKILKFCQCISLFRNYLPLEKGVALHLGNNPLQPRVICAKLG